MRTSKREDIIKVASRLISQMGYRNASFQKIADEVGIHKTTIFHYFKNKEEMLVEILGMFIDEGNARLEEIVNDRKLEPEEKLKKAFDNHLFPLLEQIEQMSIFMNELKNLSIVQQEKYLRKRKRYLKNFEKIVIQLKKVGYFRNLDSKIIALGILGLLNGVSRWFRKDKKFSIKEISSTYFKMIISGNQNSQKV